MTQTHNNESPAHEPVVEDEVKTDADPTQAETARIADQLLNDIRDSRANRDVAYRPGPTVWPPISYEHFGGLWPSTQAKHGKSGVTTKILWWLNELDGCVDYNFYSSAWIVQNLLDAHSESPSATAAFADAELARTAHVLSERFRDPLDHSSRMIFFWPKLIPTADGGLTTATVPTNLDAKTKTLLATRRTARERLIQVGLGSVVERHLRGLNSTRRGRSRFFRIPADFDDSSLYLSIGTRLRAVADRYPLSARAWEIDPAQFVGALLRYAYRPFSTDPSASMIDSRTYYWVRAFLRAKVERANQEGRAPSVVLPMSWAQSAEEACREAERGPDGNVIPFAVNNIDVTICANVLHALTAAILDDPGEWITAELEQLYRDTAELLTWVIESEVVNERGDLALVYYPDLETFYWFAARVVGQLRNAETLPALLDEARIGLQRAMRTATLHLLNSSNLDVRGQASWQGILGGDVDRVYATAAAANALFEAWTYCDAPRGRRFDEDTPARVPEVLTAAVRFLTAHARSGRYPLSNAFFCASAKSDAVVYWRYPVNVAAYTDGRPIDPSTTPFEAIRDSSFTLGVRGYVPEADYRALLEQHQFGLKPGIRRRRFTDLSYWSSEDVTRSMCLLALTRYGELVTHPGLPQTQPDEATAVATGAKPRVADRVDKMS